LNWMSLSIPSYSSSSMVPDSNSLNQEQKGQSLDVRDVLQELQKDDEGVLVMSGMDKRLSDFELTRDVQGVMQGAHGYWQIGGFLFPSIQNGDIIMRLPSYHKIDDDPYIRDSYSYKRRLIYDKKYIHNFFVIKNGLMDSRLINEIHKKEWERMDGLSLFIKYFYLVELFLGQLLFPVSDDFNPWSPELIRIHYIDELYTKFFSLKNLQLLMIYLIEMQMQSPNLPNSIDPNDEKRLMDRVSNVFDDVNPSLTGGVGMIDCFSLTDDVSEEPVIGMILDDFSRVWLSEKMALSEPVKIGKRYIIYLKGRDYEKVSVTDKCDYSIIQWIEKFAFNEYTSMNKKDFITYIHVMRSCPGAHGFIHENIKRYNLDCIFAGTRLDPDGLGYIKVNSFDLEVLTDYVNMVRQVFLTNWSYLVKGVKGVNNKFNVLRCYNAYYFGEDNSMFEYLTIMDDQGMRAIMIFYATLMSVPFFPNIILKYINKMREASDNEWDKDYAAIRNQLIWENLDEIVINTLAISHIHRSLYIHYATIFEKTRRIKLITLSKFYTDFMTDIFSGTIDSKNVMDQILTEKEIPFQLTKSFINLFPDYSKSFFEKRKILVPKPKTLSIIPIQPKKGYVNLINLK
jgi:hypothetical protein